MDTGQVARRLIRKFINTSVILIQSRAIFDSLKQNHRKLSPTLSQYMERAKSDAISSRKRLEIRRTTIPNERRRTGGRRGGGEKLKRQMVTSPGPIVPPTLYKSQKLEYVNPNEKRNKWRKGYEKAEMHISKTEKDGG